MDMSRIHVTIEQMHLKGFNSGDRYAILEGFQSELSRMLDDPSTRREWVRPNRTPVLKLGQLSLEPGTAGGCKFGNSLACAIRESLKL